MALLPRGQGHSRRPLTSGGQNIGVGHATPPGSIDGYGAEALLGARARLHLFYRLATRVGQVAYVDGGAHHSGAWQLVAWPAPLSTWSPGPGSAIPGASP